MKRIILGSIVLATAIGCGSGTFPAARLVHARLTACSPLATAVHARVAYWQQQIDSGTTSAVPRAGWAEVDSMIASHPGVLLTIEVDGEATILKRIQLDRPKEMTVTPWGHEHRSEQAFSNEYGPTCEQYPLGSSAYFLASDMGNGYYPPTHVAAFLGVKQLSRVPHFLLSYLPHDASYSQ